jgi:hypothetical protein
MNTMAMTDVSIDYAWVESDRLRDLIINESDNGTLFHRPLFLQYHAVDKFPDTQPVVISFFRKEKLVACISGAIQYANDEKRFISPFASSYGGLVFHQHLTFKEIEEVYMELLDYLHKEFSHIKLTSTPCFQSLSGKSHYVDHILLNNGFNITNSDIILVHELDSDEKLVNRIHKKTMTELKQPLFKNKLRLEIADGVDNESYDLLIQAQERLQSQPTHSLAELKLIESLIPGTVKTFRTYADDRLIAGIIVFRVSNSILSTFYVFDTPEGRNLKANHFSYFNVLRYAYQQNFRYLDFGSSSFGWRPNYPLISFKEKFDAKPFLRNTFEKTV